MDKIEKIRQEIKRRREDILSKVHHYPLHRIELLDELLSFLDTLSEEPDKSLEEAAEESAISQYSMSETEEELDVVHSRILHEVGFKAGAKWMAGQGETLEVTDNPTWGEVFYFIHRICDGVKEIQIRKKEESK